MKILDKNTRMKMTIRMILMASVVVLTIISSGGAKAASGITSNETARSEPNCDSYHAVYAPANLGSSSEQAQLTVERAENPRPGDTEAAFLLDTLGDDGQTRLSTLRMPYGCSGEGDNCQITFRLEPHHDGRPAFRSIPVIGLNSDFTPTSPISSGYRESNVRAPFALVFANLATQIQHTNWRLKRQDTQYFSTDKVPPHPYEVWLFKSCKP